ncbi:hypothetical protein Taro_041672 [Colocasia esculenta]|uniref:BED-type domain-containing protein n=1 Tax=Colocasia esculenta TaxID=4460 RepID=A0A843WXX4_COLES|nr:hypothetical protein [Colocasia esculenta]
MCDSGRCGRTWFNQEPGGLNPMRLDPARYWRIGFDSPDTLKGVGRCTANGTYGIMLENRHNFKCNYCGFTGQGGGVSLLKKHLAKTARKKADKEIQERIISGRERDEDVDDEVEMFAEYVSDPNVQERRDRAKSRAEAWEGDQRAVHRVSFHGAQHEVGSGSGSGSAGAWQAD